MNAKNRFKSTSGAAASGIVIPFRCPHAGDGFTPEDLRALRRCGPETARVEIEDEAVGQLAMIYEGDTVWASWAIGREGPLTVLWDCVSLATLGRYACVRDALAAIPTAPAAARGSADVIPFPAFRRAAALPGHALHQ